MTKIVAADLFCGAGGWSTGLIEACEELGLELDLTVVNHWELAIETHKLNHPGIKHLQADLGGINPRNAIPGGHLDILIASPECIYFSRARGGKAINDQARSTAFCVLRWAEALDIETILIENVEEIRKWGPLYPDDHPDVTKRNKPIKEKEGQLFRHFINGLKILGYAVDHNILNSAYYGAATARERFFLQAYKKRSVKQRVRISWPTPSHTPAPSLFDEQKPFRAAKEIIEWDRKGKSIFNRKKRLVDSTMRRIWAGVKKFSDLEFIFPEGYDQNEYLHTQPLLVRIPMRKKKEALIRTPEELLFVPESNATLVSFLTVARNHCDAISMNAPVPTICAGGNHMYLTTPFLAKYHGSHNGRFDGDNRHVSLDGPMPTLDTQPRFALCESFLTMYYGGHDARSLELPLPTVTANYEHYALTQPYLVGYKSTDGAFSLESPLKTLTTRDRFALCQPLLMPAHGFHWNDPQALRSFLIPNFGEAPGQDPRCHSIHSPLPTVTTRGAGNLVNPFIVPTCHTKSNIVPWSVDEPLRTITTARGGEFAIANPFVIPVTHHGSPGRVYDLSKPLPTITTAHRGEMALINSYLIAMEHSSDASGHWRRCFSLDRPLPTVTTRGSFGLMMPCLVNMKGQSTACSIDKPVPTLTAHAPHLYLCNPYLLKFYGASDGYGDLAAPLPTITTARNRFAIAQPVLDPFFVKYYGTATCSSIHDPLPTVTTNDRFALVVPELVEILGIDKGDIIGLVDILYRMLVPPELAAAMGFSPDYQFVGNQEQIVKQIGNAVEKNVGKALCKHALTCYLELQKGRTKRKAA